jgi:hypothetical protein
MPCPQIGDPYIDIDMYVWASARDRASASANASANANASARARARARTREQEMLAWRREQQRKSDVISGLFWATAACAAAVCLYLTS